MVDPAQFGFGDPGALLDPDTGISQLLAQAESAKLGEEKRVGGEVVPRGDRPDPRRPRRADPHQHRTRASRCEARFSIAPESGELRRAELTGPFYEAGTDATFTVRLSDFGADVQITAPPTG